MTKRTDSRKCIAVVTGTRAEYGLLKSTMRAIDAHPRLTLQVVVAGMHLLRKFGRTVDDIRADNIRIDATVPMQRGDDDPCDQAAGLGRGVTGIAKYILRAKTDMVVVLGDRIEAAAGALAAVTAGRALAHIHGGDVALGDFDESLRHAITKLAHVHLAATKDAARRIIRMGERPEHVHCVGAPGLDRLREIIAETPARQGRSNTALVVQHASGRTALAEERVAAMILDAVAGAGLKRIVLYPNSDRGHRGVLRAIDRHEGAARAGEVLIRRSLPRDDYLRTLLEADVLIGNSSSGLIEAPLAGTPTVNVGDRQANRLPGGSAVIACGESPREVKTALRQAMQKRPRRGGRNVYGEGRAGLLIADVLAGTRVSTALLRKQISY